MMRLILALYLIMMSLSSQQALAADTGYSSEYHPENASLSVEARLDQYFFRAAREGDLPVLQTFIDARQNLNRQDSKGYTALILAAYHGHREAVELLLKQGANADFTDKRGNTALFGAIFKGELSIAKRLMQAQGNTDQANRAGQTPAMYAALFGRAELLAELQRKGADLDRQDAFGNSAHTLAAGQIQTVSQTLR